MFTPRVSKTSALPVVPDMARVAVFGYVHPGTSHDKRSGGRDVEPSHRVATSAAGVDGLDACTDVERHVSHRRTPYQRSLPASRLSFGGQ